MELDLDKVNKAMAAAVTALDDLNEVVAPLVAPLVAPPVARIEELEAKQRELVDDLDAADYNAGLFG